jgi:hypothetical protein
LGDRVLGKGRSALTHCAKPHLARSDGAGMGLRDGMFPYQGYQGAKTLASRSVEVRKGPTEGPGRLRRGWQNMVPKCRDEQ